MSDYSKRFTFLGSGSHALYSLQYSTAVLLKRSCQSNPTVADERLGQERGPNNLTSQAYPP